MEVIKVETAEKLVDDEKASQMGNNPRLVHIIDPST
jgi:hypothetical protein